MFILSSISRGLELWSANHTSKCGSSELKVFENIKFLGEISNIDQIIYSKQMYARLKILLIILVKNTRMY